MGRLQRLEKGRGIQVQDAAQLGTGDAPALSCACCSRAAATRMRSEPMAMSSAWASASCSAVGRLIGNGRSHGVGTAEAGAKVSAAGTRGRQHKRLLARAVRKVCPQQRDTQDARAKQTPSLGVRIDHTNSPEQPRPAGRRHYSSIGISPTVSTISRATAVESIPSIGCRRITQLAEMSRSEPTVQQPLSRRSSSAYIG